MGWDVINMELGAPSGMNLSPSKMYFLLSAKLPEGSNGETVPLSSRTVA